MIKISEHFKAIQGEGLTAGLPVYFIRLSGCNLSCDWCDSKYHWHGKTYMNEDIVNHIRDSKLEDVVFTGGEPTLQIKKISEIMSYLPRLTFHLETNGTIYDDFVRDFKFIACSPKKQAISKLESYKKYNNLPQTFFKFVYENKNDQWWLNFMKKVNIPKSKVWIMSEGATRDEQIKKMPEVMEYCLKNKFKFSPRLQVLAYDTKRGK